MLLESLLEVPAPQRRRRECATLISFALQAAGIALLVMLPLLYTDALPHWRDNIVVMPTPPPGRPPQPPAGSHPRRTAGNSPSLATLLPIRIPHGVHQESEPEQAPSEPVADTIGIPGSTGPAGPNALLQSLLPHNVVPLPPPPPRRLPVTVSGGVIAGWKIRDLQPPYPPLAAAAGIEGEVVLSAVIARDGTIENLQVLSGHPLLIRAAADAVRQWRYRPYYLNGQAVEVATEIRVRFVLRR